MNFSTHTGIASFRGYTDAHYGSSVMKIKTFEQLLQFPQQLLLDYVHLAAHVSNGLKPESAR